MRPDQLVQELNLNVGPTFQSVALRSIDAFDRLESLSHTLFQRAPTAQRSTNCRKLIERWCVDQRALGSSAKLWKKAVMSAVDNVVDVVCSPVKIVSRTAASHPLS